LRERAAAGSGDRRGDVQGNGGCGQVVRPPGAVQHVQESGAAADSAVGHDPGAHAAGWTMKTRQFTTSRVLSICMALAMAAPLAAQGTATQQEQQLKNKVQDF